MITSVFGTDFLPKPGKPPDQTMPLSADVRRARLVSDQNEINEIMSFSKASVTGCVYTKCLLSVTYILDSLKRP